MKVALISDLHLGFKNTKDIFLKSQLRFLKNEFVPYLLENNIDTIFILGDVFDNRNALNHRLQNIVFNFFEKQFKPFKVYIIVGNHDTYFNNTIDVHSLRFLSKFQNVEIIEEMKNTNVGGKNFLMVPWITDEVEFYKEFQDKKYDVCMGHFHFAGFSMNKSKISEEGLSSSMFSNRPGKVFSGHFHTRSRQQKGEAEIIYLGSPYQLTRHDIDEERGFCVLDTDTLAHEYVNNKTSMRYIRLDYPQKFSKDIVRGNLIDIYVRHDDTYESKKIEKYIESVEECEPADMPTIFVIESSIKSKLNSDKYEVGSITDLIKDYIQSIDINNKDEILDDLMVLYKEVRGDDLE